MLPKIAIRTTGRDLSEAARQAMELATKEVAWDHLGFLEQAQLRATRPDLFQEGEGNDKEAEKALSLLRPPR